MIRLPVSVMQDLAHCLEDATFYIADESNFVDRFEIRNGSLSNQTVYEGEETFLDEYFNKNVL